MSDDDLKAENTEKKSESRNAETGDGALIDGGRLTAVFGKAQLAYDTAEKNKGKYCITSIDTPLKFVLSY